MTENGAKVIVNEEHWGLRKLGLPKSKTKPLGFISCLNSEQSLIRLITQARDRIQERRSSDEISHHYTRQARSCLQRAKKERRIQQEKETKKEAAIMTLQKRTNKQRAEEGKVLPIQEEWYQVHRL